MLIHRVKDEYTHEGARRCSALRACAERRRETDLLPQDRVLAQTGLPRRLLCAPALQIAHEFVVHIPVSSHSHATHFL